ncbi:unnamed protein product [Closterium sp. NIES-65]|nr:unnamed protein product [Closterium sp. NIES-65]
MLREPLLPSTGGQESNTRATSDSAVSHEYRARVNLTIPRGAATASGPPPNRRASVDSANVTISEGSDLCAEADSRKRRISFGNERGEAGGSGRRGRWGSGGPGGGEGVRSPRSPGLSKQEVLGAFDAAEAEGEAEADLGAHLQTDFQTVLNTINLFVGAGLLSMGYAVMLGGWMSLLFPLSTQLLLATLFCTTLFCTTLFCTTARLLCPASSHFTCPLLLPAFLLLPPLFRPPIAPQLVLALCTTLFCTTARLLCRAFDALPPSTLQSYPALARFAFGLPGEWAVSVTSVALDFGFCVVHSPAPCILLLPAFSCSLHSPAPCILLLPAFSCSLHSPAPCILLLPAFSCSLHSPAPCILLLPAFSCSLHSPAPCILLLPAFSCSLHSTPSHPALPPSTLPSHPALPPSTLPSYPALARFAFGPPGEWAVMVAVLFEFWGALAQHVMVAVLFEFWGALGMVSSSPSSPNKMVMVAVLFEFWGALGMCLIIVWQSALIFLPPLPTLCLPSFATSAADASAPSAAALCLLPRHLVIAASLALVIPTVLVRSFARLTNVALSGVASSTLLCSGNSYLSLVPAHFSSLVSPTPLRLLVLIIPTVLARSIARLTKSALSGAASSALLACILSSSKSPSVTSFKCPPSLARISLSDPSSAALPEPRAHHHSTVSWSHLPMAAGIFMVSLSGHAGLPSLRRSMRTPQHFDQCIIVTFSSMFLLYATMGGFAYLYFGDSVCVLVTASLYATMGGFAYLYFGDSVRVLVTASLGDAGAVAWSHLVLPEFPLASFFPLSQSSFTRSTSYATMGGFAYLYFGDSVRVLVTASLDDAGAAAGIILLQWGSVSVSLSALLSLLVAASVFTTIPALVYVMSELILDLSARLGLPVSSHKPTPSAADPVADGAESVCPADGGLPPPQCSAQPVPHRHSAIAEGITRVAVTFVGYLTAYLTYDVLDRVESVVGGVCSVGVSMVLPAVIFDRLYSHQLSVIQLTLLRGLIAFGVIAACGIAFINIFK